MELIVIIYTCVVCFIGYTTYKIEKLPAWVHDVEPLYRYVETININEGFVKQ
jgi:hypothetical protein